MPIDAVETRMLHVDSLRDLWEGPAGWVAPGMGSVAWSDGRVRTEHWVSPAAGVLQSQSEVGMGWDGIGGLDGPLGVALGVAGHWGFEGWSCGSHAGVEMDGMRME